ncbi:unnamed protein product [Rotaria sp. Silwood1]|nr:unnamed protein product [Rotaria sp. Silwood1]CAF1626523.1 unnamed protein product [Rotaria sp. Silwood1]CAF3777140.1 unnamed protein product [Rotaria sp. Silwood1]CAF3840086.1 unnamed protein product [Rotaria sp. Silwood1]CAF4873412.1 unnamed protein product [Rotaria sp. Silwood1]
MSSKVTGIDGNWKIINYPPHPECVGCVFKITSENPNIYRLHASVINSINCSLEYNSENNEWKRACIGSTLMVGAPEETKKEEFIHDLIANFQSLHVEGEQHLIIQTNSGEQARLERFAVPAS